MCCVDIQQSLRMKFYSSFVFICITLDAKFRDGIYAEYMHTYA